ncbi:hypothetical protein J6590_047028 [Homalodisca vitripennis]|nr:hypothetical protein J6590_047028 [Homalodisca vitripennis]
MDSKPQAVADFPQTANWTVLVIKLYIVPRSGPMDSKPQAVADFPQIANWTVLFIKLYIVPRLSTTGLTLVAGRYGNGSWLDAAPLVNHGRCKLARAGTGAAEASGSRIYSRIINVCMARTNRIPLFNI